MVLNQPFDPLLPVRQNILWAEPRPLDDGLAAPLSGHGLDQGAFGPVNVFHDRSLTRSRPGAPAVTQLMAVLRHYYLTRHRLRILTSLRRHFVNDLK